MVDRYENLKYNIYGLNLHYGKITPKLGHNVELFYIVEHTDDEQFIRKEALQMLQQFGQSVYYFFGKNEPIWHLIFDETYILLNSNAEGVAMTVGYDMLDDFISELDDRKHLIPFVPCDYYLIYDDEAIYQKIKQRLELKEGIKIWI